MQTLVGIAVSSGIGIGQAIIISDKSIEIEKRHIDQAEIEKEQGRYISAIEAISKNIDEHLDQFIKAKEEREIFEAHKMILADPEIQKGVFDLIARELHNLEYALKIYFDKTISFFKEMKNVFYAERAGDYQDIYERLINHLQNKSSLIIDEMNQDSIVLMRDCPPSMIAELIKKKVQGLVLVKGNKTSHAVILARGMSLPVVTGIQFNQKIKDGDDLILDAEQGIVFVNPDEKLLNKYHEQKAKENEEMANLKSISSLPTVTADGKVIQLMANIEMPEEMEIVNQNNADGIGLFRTEFLYMDRDSLPTENELFEFYKAVSEQAKEKPVIVRTIDVGGDKMAKWYPHLQEINPYLGCRGIRFSLTYPEIFKTQIRAILRAAEFGNLQIMFPLVSSVEEFRKAKDYVLECAAELQYKQEIRIGTMIEIPSAALIADQLAKESDFFSIGTNDLLQYTVAVDRNNETIAGLYNSYHPAFLKLIKMTAEAAKSNNIMIAVCGELAANESFIGLLLKFGVQELSVSTHSLLKTRRFISSINYQKLVDYPDILTNIGDSGKMKEAIDKMNTEIIEKKEKV
ncbi:MAG TPA: phosphoenolpyruvate--protein phosphotransferase [Candidatus Cloacimonadota bacterium]|nr:phosphoenolpyruvate--protein phosphotransferase [Candidatus Cloacimonadota bacterium]HOQ80162.1 phosphoenolpyruvate--protein phosphotransferase [Candidatus Cloacimonadota bacterium]HPK40033.1 phosphoenolpyruvate--protein phosphotransferase [Candidatus Cloacimonadota bacterium]